MTESKESHKVKSFPTDSVCTFNTAAALSICLMKRSLLAKIVLMLLWTEVHTMKH